MNGFGSAGYVYKRYKKAHSPVVESARPLRLEAWLGEQVGVVKPKVESGSYRK